MDETKIDSENDFANRMLLYIMSMERVLAANPPHIDPTQVALMEPDGSVKVLRIMSDSQTQ